MNFKVLTEIKMRVPSQITWEYYLIDDEGNKWECNTYDPDIVGANASCVKCGTDFVPDQDIFVKLDEHPSDEEPRCRKCVVIVPLNEMRNAWKLCAGMTELHQRIARRLE